MTQAAKPGSRSSRRRKVLFQLVAVVTLATPFVIPLLLIGHLKWGQQVVSRVDLGVVMGMDANREPLPVGAPSPRWVIATHQAYYPLFEPLVIEKGARVFLVTTRSGGQQICDQEGTVCARTGRADQYISR